MAMKRLRNHHLPLGVYERCGKYRAFKWDTKGRTTVVALCTTPEEAAYKRLLGIQGHHWLNMEEDLEEYFGFTYLITNKKTGKKYVGKKQFYLWDGPVGGFKCTDPRSEWWDAKAWKNSSWQTYTGSCEELNQEILSGNVWDYQYEVLELCHDKLSLHISEINHMMLWNVLYATDSKGEYVFYNKNIASLEFRPPFKRHEVELARENSMEAMRIYYLKPKHCPVCNSVIPYGVSTCCKEPTLEFSNGR